MKKQEGFTLVEIAIVLVIIGLLLGGALKGQELIENARISRIKTDLDQISAAIYSYQDRYGVLPGDDANADVNVGSSVKGNGGGTIGGSWNQTGQENTFAWDHLRRAGFLNGTGQDNPLHAFGANIALQNGPWGISGLGMCFVGLSGEAARIMDVRYDDGIRNTGQIRASNSAGDFAATGNLLCFGI